MNAGLLPASPDQEELLSELLTLRSLTGSSGPQKTVGNFYLRHYLQDKVQLPLNSKPNSLENGLKLSLAFSLTRTQWFETLESPGFFQGHAGHHGGRCPFLCQQNDILFLCGLSAIILGLLYFDYDEKSRRGLFISQFSVDEETLCFHVMKRDLPFNSQAPVKAIHRHN